jgi:hypothetical protein
VSLGDDVGILKTAAHTGILPLPVAHHGARDSSLGKPQPHFTVLMHQRVFASTVIGAVLDASVKPSVLTSYWHVRAHTHASSAIITLESTPNCRA